MLNLGQEYSTKDRALSSPVARFGHMLARCGVEPRIVNLVNCQRHDRGNLSTQNCRRSSHKHQGHVQTTRL